MPMPEEYESWAPATSPWSLWVKPVLFHYMKDRDTSRLKPATVRTPDWLAEGKVSSLLIIDYPGVESIQQGICALKLGFRPIPVFNACPGPAAILDIWPLVDALKAGARLLEEARLPDTAPPAFLIDSMRRDARGAAVPGRFDNRWAVVPQDFPSGNFILSCGIRRVVHMGPRLPDDDLAHALIRWKKAGLELFHANSFNASLKPLPVRPPYGFGSMLYRFLMLGGLRRNSTGGFGGIIPEPSEFSGGG